MCMPSGRTQERPTALIKLTSSERASFDPPSCASTLIGIDLPAHGPPLHPSIFALYQPLSPLFTCEMNAARRSENTLASSGLRGVAFAWANPQGSQSCGFLNEGLWKVKRDGMRTSHFAGSN